MHNPDEPRQTRRLRLPRRRSTRFLLVAGVVVAALAPAAWANHQFADVPTSSPHHNDISTIANAGITGGCAPSLYCPDQFVRRDQMASFIQRGAGRGARFQDSVLVTATTTPDQVLASLNISVPGNGYVLVNAAADYAISGGVCNVVQRIRRPTSGDASFYSGTGSGPSGDTGVSSTLLSPVTDGPGTRIFTLEGRKFSGACTASAFIDMNAVWVPFNATGGGVTSASTPSGAGQSHITDGAAAGNREN